MSQLAFELIPKLASEEGFAATLRRRAAATPRRVALPEATDERVLAAAAALRELGLARPLLVGEARAVRRGLSAMGLDPGAFAVADPAGDPRRPEVAARLRARRSHRGLSQGEAHVLSGEPLHLAAGLLGLGQVDAVVAGAVHATGDVLRAGLWHVGMAEGIAVASGSFLMLPPAGHALVDRPLLFADAAVLPAPDEEQLVAIGRASAAMFADLAGRPGRIACLSFSTKGSAEHPSASRMAAVARRLREAGHEADGELQLDAALVPAVGASKAPGSPVAGRADILLFPDLGAANIGYKMAQRLGGFAAIGPLVQGLARPVFDLSRGCDAADIVNTACIAALRARGDDGPAQ